MDLGKLVQDSVREHDTSGFRTLMAMGVEINRTYQGLSPLHVACSTGNTAMVIEILQMGGNVEQLVVEHSDEEINQLVGYSPLLIASRSGSTDTVLALANHGVNTEVVGRDGKTALVWACESGHLDILLCLIRCGSAFIRSGSFVPLFLAASKGHNSIIEAILQAGVPLNLSDNKQWNMLHFAAMNGQADTVRYLMNKHCPVLKSTNGVSPALLAAAYGHLAVLRVFGELQRGNQLIKASNSDNESPLHMAAKKGYIDIARYLLHVGCDINQGNWTGHTPLCYAVRHSHTGMVELLVENGCDTNIPKIPYLPPIFQARHKLNMVKILVKGGADVNVVDMADGSLLMYAAGQSEVRGLELLVFLLENGAWVDQQCFWGETALFKAIVSSNLAVMKLLIQYGSNINIRNARALTPLQVAVSRGFTEGVELLVKSGVNVHQKAAFSKETILEYALMKAAKPNLCRLLRSSGAVIRPTFYSRYFERELRESMNSSGHLSQQRPLSQYIHGHLHGNSGKMVLSKFVTHYRHLIAELLEPISLQDQLRNFIRRSVNFQDSKVASLPIPPLLKHLLLFEDTRLQSASSYVETGIQLMSQD